MQFSRYSVQELPAQTTSLQIVADGNILRKNTPIKHQFHLSKLVNVPSGARRNLNLSSTLCQAFFKKVFSIQCFLRFQGKKKQSHSHEWDCPKEIAAATYFPTQSPVQYHRRGEA